MMKTYNRSSAGLLTTQASNRLRQGRTLAAYWIALLMVTLGLAAPAKAEFRYDRFESYNYLTLTTPSSTTDVGYGSNVALNVEVRYNSWEVWVDDETNTSEIRSSFTDVVSSASVAVIVEYGDSSVDSSTISTNSSGQASANMTMGSQATRIRAEYGGAAAALDFTPPSAETFSYDRTETALMTNLTSMSGSTGVESGAERHLQLITTFNTWEVWISNFGNVEHRNSNVGGASGASVNLVIESGDGSTVSGSGYNDGSGNLSWVTFVMGTQNTRVRADVSFSGYTASSAVDFTLPSTETFSYSHVETSVTATVGGSGPTTGLQPGALTGVVITANYSSYEVWVSNHGNTEQRNPSSGPAIGASSSFSIESGDGYVYSPSYTTDSSGQAYASLTMGSQGTTVLASVNFGGYTASGTVSFSLAPVEEVFTYDHTEYSTSVTLSAPDGSIIPVSGSKAVVASVQTASSEIWLGNLGSTQVRNTSSSGAAYATVSFSIDNNAFGASISSGSNATDSQGLAYATVYANETAPRVRVDVQDNGRSASATLDFSIDYGPPPEVFQHDHNESSSSVGFYSVDSPFMLAPGTVRMISASGGTSTWEVWVSNYGNTDNRNYSFTPFENLYPTIDYGDGTYLGSGPSIMFTMAQTATRLSLSAGGSTATIEFTPDVFNFDGYAYSDLAAYLSTSQTTSNVPAGQTRTAQVYVTGNTVEVWRGVGSGAVDYRNPVSGYVAGIPVSFTATDGNALSPASGTTNAYGNLSTTLTMGMNDTALQASVGTGSGIVVTDSITFTTDGFHFDHYESAVTPTFTVTGTTSELPAGATRPVQLKVTYKTWEVWVNGLGVEEMRNVSPTINAAGAQVNLSILSGDGSLSISGGTTDSLGILNSTFTMGTMDTEIKAVVTYEGATGETTQLFQASTDPYQYIRTDTSLITSISGGGSGLSEGQEASVQVHVSYRTVEIWEHKMNPGDFQERFATVIDASNASVSMVTESGGGFCNPSSGTADTSGNFTTLFIMGSDDSTVRADAAYESAFGSSSSIQFSH